MLDAKAKFFKTGELITVEELQTAHKIDTNLATRIYKSLLKRVGDEFFDRESLYKDRPELRPLNHDDLKQAHELNLLAFEHFKQEKQQKTKSDVCPIQNNINDQTIDYLREIRARYDEEIKSKGEQTTIKEGFIYLLEHPSFFGWVKTGMTVDYESRLKTYNTGDPLCRYDYLIVKPVKDHRQAELKLLSKLTKIASEVRGEWFLIHYECALNILHTEISTVIKVQAQAVD